MTELNWKSLFRSLVNFCPDCFFLKMFLFSTFVVSLCLYMCVSLTSQALPSVFPRIRIFSNESALHIRWPKYWSFSISSSNEYSGLISFRIEWFDLLAVQGVLESFFSNTVWRHQFNTMIFNKVNIFSFLKNVLQSAPKISDLYGHFRIHWLYLMTPLSRNVTVP